MGHTLNLPANMDTQEYVVSYIYGLADDGDLDLHNLDAVRAAAEDAAKLISRNHWQTLANLAVAEVMYEEAA